MINFIIGLFVGGFLGILAMSLCVIAAGAPSEDKEKEDA